MNNSELQKYNSLLVDGYPLMEESLALRMGEWTVGVRSNSNELLQRLKHYFRHMLVPVAWEQVSVPLLAIQRDPVQLDLEFKDWKRDAGKSGRKDACYDIEAGRLIHKVRTGMLFLQCEQNPVAAGDCLANDNQVINFINAQFMNWLQQQSWLICHAAAVEYRGVSIAIAAFSGGGKSTTMLRLMDLPDTRFLTNDRLFIHRDEARNAVQVAGVPKLPRINPGTIITNPVLQGILSPEREQALLSLPKQALWELEEKYDVDVLELYGEGRIEHLADLDCFLILNWRHESGAMNVRAVDLAQRRDLLPAVMKAPGPFYQQSDGQFHSDQVQLDQQRYIDALASAAVFEVSGGVDFDGLVHWCQQRLG